MSLGVKDRRTGDLLRPGAFQPKAFCESQRAALIEPEIAGTDWVG